MARVPALRCAACRRSFGGDRTFREHRVLAGDRHRCRTDGELLSRGLWRDKWNVWHRGSPSGQLSLLGVTEADRTPSRPAPDRAMVGQYHRNGHDTEVAAAESVAPRSGTQRARVLELFRSGRGWTDYELGEALHLFRWVAGTRRGELIRDGWPIEDSGDRRMTDTGTKAIVWSLRQKEVT